ncbi:MAG: helix-turn-helix domain-containing protein [Pseudomonadota bacterium]
MRDPIEIDEELASGISVPSQLADFVEILGIAGTVQFLLHFGGTEVYLPPHPSGRSRLERLIGADAIRALSARSAALSVDVPLANTWIAAVLTANGATTRQVARHLRVTERTARRWRQKARTR